MLAEETPSDLDSELVNDDSGVEEEKEEHYTPPPTPKKTRLSEGLSATNERALAKMNK